MPLPQMPLCTSPIVAILLFFVIPAEDREEGMVDEF